MPVPGAGGIHLDIQPAAWASARNAASASGERQMLPRQTNRTDGLIG
jgi:hypothetical protein